MTKRKANPRPHRFQPGHTINVKAPGTQLVGIRAMIRPDQRRRLDEEPNISAAVRAALDTYFSIHINADDAVHDAAYKQTQGDDDDD